MQSLKFFSEPLRQISEPFPNFQTNIYPVDLNPTDNQFDYLDGEIGKRRNVLNI